MTRESDESQLREPSMTNPRSDIEVISAAIDWFEDREPVRN
jgi:hypothetical protein